MTLQDLHAEIVRLVEDTVSNPPMRAANAREVKRLIAEYEPEAPKKRGPRAKKAQGDDE